MALWGHFFMQFNENKRSPGRCWSQRPEFLSIDVLHKIHLKTLCNLTVDIILKVGYTYGIKRKEVSFMKSKLSAMPYAQAYAIKALDGSIGLVSYQTVVAAIDKDGWLRIGGLYSATTRRHIGAFVKEYAGIYYQTAKQLYNNHCEMNIHTGEIRDISD